jgi:hypothetical protein
MDELMDHIESYFTRLSGVMQKDTSGEAFLMGGHCWLANSVTG